MSRKNGCWGYNATGDMVFLYCVDCEHQNDETMCQEIHIEHDTTIVYKPDGGEIE